MNLDKTDFQLERLPNGMWRAVRGPQVGEGRTPGDACTAAKSAKR